MTVRGQVTRAELISTGSGLKGQVLRAELYSQAASPSRGQVLRAELYSTSASSPSRAQVLRAELYSTGANATAVSPDGPVPSHSYVTLAAAYNGPSPTPSYQWAQVSGPTVTLTPNDALATCVVQIPALWAPASVVVQARVLESDGATPWATCTLTVARHEVWQIQVDGDHPLGAWAVMDMPGTPTVPPNPNPPGPVVPPPGTPTDGLWFTALAPGTGTFKSMPHFYPPFPISVQNDAHPNYHERTWLTPAIEGTTDHRKYGGYTRDRPYDTFDNSRPQPAGWQAADAVQNVQQAALYGLDGFWLEMLGTISSANNVRNLAIRDAAASLYPDGSFKTSPMPDMNNPTINAMTADQLADLIAPFAVTNPTPGLTSYTRHPSAWYLGDGRFVWSCFRGDVAASGSITAWPAARWQAVFTSLSTRYLINSAFIIGVNNYLNAVNYVGAGFYGYNHWGAGADPGIARGMSNLTADAHSRSQVFMASVWPSDIRPYVSLYDDAYNTECLRAYCDRMVSDQPDYAQLTTWSDYSEGGMFQRSYGRGRVLQKIYAWYAYNRKTGAFPAILRDVVVLSHRNQLFPTGSTYRYDTSGGGVYTNKMAHWDRGANTSPVRNNVEVLTFLLAPGAVTLKVGATTVTYTAPAGMYAHAFTPAEVGAVSVDVKRSGVSVATILSPFVIKNNPFNQNPYYYMMDSLDGVTNQFDPVETVNP